MNLEELKATAKQIPFRDPPPSVRASLRASLVAAACAEPVGRRRMSPRATGVALAAAFAAAAALALWLLPGDRVVVGSGTTSIAEPVGPPRAQIDAAPGAVFEHTRLAKERETHGVDEVVRVRQGEIAVRVDPRPAAERFRILAGDAEIEVTSGAASIRVLVADQKLSEVRLESGRAELHRPGWPPIALSPGVSWRAPAPPREPGAGAWASGGSGGGDEGDGDLTARALALRHNAGDACMSCLLGADPESCKRAACSIGACPEACFDCILVTHDLAACDVCPQDGSCVWPTFDGEHACWADRSCGSLVDDAFCHPTDEGGTACEHPCADCVAVEGGDAEAERRCGCEPGSFQDNPGWECLRNADGDWTQCEDALCPESFFGPDFTCVQIQESDDPCFDCLRGADSWTECVDSCCTPREDEPWWIGPSFCGQIPDVPPLGDDLLPDGRTGIDELRGARGTKSFASRGN